ncbi:hypothetical protein GCM10022275_16350 [Tessaracoccus defluvii]
MVLLPVQVFGVLLTGARGATVAMIVGLVVLGGLAMHARSKGGVGRFFLVLAVLLSVGGVGLSRLSSVPTAGRVLERVFAYIGDSGVDWEGTSGRGDVYGSAFEAIDESPFFGYGLFSWGSESYPHNLFLELMLNGGVLYLGVSVLIIGVLMVKLLRSPFENVVVIAFAIYPLVMLQFSGSYWTAGSFWFVLGYALVVGVQGVRGVEPSRADGSGV